MDLTQEKEKCFILGPSDAKSFEYVKTNVPGPGFDADMFMEQYEGCRCEDGCTKHTCPCVRLFGPAYDCDGNLLENCFAGDGHKVNRSILECGNACKCKDSGKCCLRVVQKGILQNLKVIVTNHKGYGLISVGEIKRLCFVCEYAGEVIDEKEAKLRLQTSQNEGRMNYLIAVKEFFSSAPSSKQCFYIDPREIGNIGRFINHSCDPNLIMLPVRVNHPVPRLALFARRNINSEEELTFDYSGGTTLLSNLRSNGDGDNISQNSGDSLKCIDKHLPFQGSVACTPHGKTMLTHLDNGTEQTGTGTYVNEVILDTGIETQTSEESHCDDNNDNDNHALKVGDVVEDKTPNRTKCFCGSGNCSGYLPFDEALFV